MLELWEKNKFWEISPGALNENIVQNHLNIFHLFRFPSWKSSDPKIIGIKTYLFENFSQKKVSRKLLVTFLG